MNYYRISEGFDDESFMFEDLIHKVDFTEDQFDKMYYEAREEAKKRTNSTYLTAEEIADVMCDKFRFKRIKIKFVRNADRDVNPNPREPQTNEGAFEAIDDVMDVFRNQIKVEAKLYAESLDRELTSLLDNHITKDRK